MKPIVVVGSTGMLGRAVVRFLKRREMPVLPVSRDEFDIAREPFPSFEKYMAGAGAVINCAGVIKSVMASVQIEDVLRVNCIFPRNLAKRCRGKGIPCIHVTTDCVYSGRKGSYTEDDPFDADDVYGMTKNAGESEDAMVLRTSIIGEEEPGRKRSLLEWARSQAGKAVQGYTNHRWNGVTTVTLAEIILRILAEGAYREGTYHLHSPEPVTKLELVRLIGDVYDLGLDITPTEAPASCDRTLASRYDFAERFCRRPLTQQLRETREFFQRA